MPDTLTPPERETIVRESRALLDRLLASPAAGDRERSAALLHALRQLAKSAEEGAS